MAFTRAELEQMVGGPVTIGPNGVARRVWPGTKELANANASSAPVPPKDRYKSKWERMYAQRLGVLLHAQAITWWDYECLKLRLADATFWTPDFAVESRGRLAVHEVKGHWREDARIKVKLAAKLFPWLPIHILRPVNGEFRSIETFNT
jgi:hypothetical protein